MLRLGLSERVSGLCKALVRRWSSEYCSRSHACGELGLEQVGVCVTLAGWVHARRVDQFLILRDITGVCQVKLPSESNLHDLPNESVVVLKGVVQQRPPGQENPNMATGQIEVELTGLIETSKAAAKLPIQQSKHSAAKEDVRMRYRYLALRNEDIQRHLILRSQITMDMRRFLIGKGFLDIETPTLFRRTPGGAKEFVVPSRRAGHFYSLVQSPQQLKQLLMVGGLDRYFQIARCYRDEGGKPDRQPEFTQLDMEVSFADREDILGLVEDLLAAVWPHPVARPMQRITYQQAMRLYGVDKPDTRYANTIQDFTQQFRHCGFELIEKELRDDEEFFIGCVFFPSEDAKCLKLVEKEVKSDLSDQIKEHSSKTVLISPLSTICNKLTNSVLKKCSEKTRDVMLESVGGNQVGFLVCCQRELCLSLLGRFRTSLARHLIPSLGERPHSFLWVVDFPLFLPEEGRLESAHHPFTAVHPEDRVKLHSDPLSCRSLHYDLVLDGQEIGGGSVRIHSENDQRFVIENVLKGEVKELEHLLTALGSGAPPHAGIALGLDRILAILTRANSIRDVIAFPKSSDGRDMMSGAPAPITEEQRSMYHLGSKP